MNPVRRLQNDLSRLRKAQNELSKDKKELKGDRKELARDRKAVESLRTEVKKDLKAYDKTGKTLEKDQKTRDEGQAKIDADRQAIEKKYQDGFDADPLMEGQQVSSEDQMKLDALDQRQSDFDAKWDPRIASDRQARTDARTEVQGDRSKLGDKRTEVKKDRTEVKRDEREVKRDQNVVKKDRRAALKHLRPAEYKMGLKATNRARRELGLDRVSQVIRPMNLNTVQGCAQFLLKSPNVSFWTGLSTGSDRKNMERLARGEKAFVPATGGYVTPKLQMMQALVAMAKKGNIMINALTGGSHSPNSNHYRGLAVDLDLSTGNSGMIEATARQYGGVRNYETSHIHLDF